MTQAVAGLTVRLDMPVTARASQPRDVAKEPAACTVTKDSTRRSCVTSGACPVDLSRRPSGSTAWTPARIRNQTLSPTPSRTMDQRLATPRIVGSTNLPENHSGSRRPRPTPAHRRRAPRGASTPGGSYLCGAEDFPTVVGSSLPPSQTTYWGRRITGAVLTTDLLQVASADRCVVAGRQNAPVQGSGRVTIFCFTRASRCLSALMRYLCMSSMDGSRGSAISMQRPAPPTRSALMRNPALSFGMITAGSTGPSC